jgi:hypothetical protein
MSDYLWDKTGEPDEDVARLEELLGTLRYEPRPLVLPTELGAQTARSKFRPQRSFKRQWLALAAALLLMLLTGVWMLKWQHDNRARREAAIKTNSKSVTHETVPNGKTAPAEQTASTTTKEQLAPSQIKEFTPIKASPPKRVIYRAARAPRHVRSIRSAPREQVATNRHSENANATLKQQQQQATEQLLLALRITSAKLNYAERQVQELSAARKPETR